MKETTRAVRRQVKPVTLPAVRLLNDNVLIEVLPPSTATAGGLIIPDSAECLKPSYEGALAGRMHEGVVLATGPGARDKQGKLHPVEVVPGDHVKFYFVGDYYLNWPTDRHRIMRESMVQAIIES